MSFSWLLDIRVQECRVVRHVKPPRYGEASRRPHALSRVRTQAIGALAPGSYPLSYPSARFLAVWWVLVCDSPGQSDTRTLHSASDRCTDAECKRQMHRASGTIPGTPKSEAKRRKVSKQRRCCSTCPKHFTTQRDCLQRMKSLRNSGENAICCPEIGAAVKTDSFFPPKKFYCYRARWDAEILAASCSTQLVSSARFDDRNIFLNLQSIYCCRMILSFHFLKRQPTN